MSDNNSGVIEIKSDITPEEPTEEQKLAVLRERAFEAEKAIQEFREARLAFVRKHTEFPKGELLDKSPTPLHESLALYIAAKTGHHVDGTVVKIVQLTLALHGEHQASNEWKAKKAALDSARAAEKEAAKQKTKVLVEKRTDKKLDQVGKALAVGVELLKAGVELPETVMANLRIAAEAAGIVLPGDEPEPEDAPESVGYNNDDPDNFTEADPGSDADPETSPEEQVLNSEIEAKPKPTTTPRRAPKAKTQPKAKADA